MAGMMDGAAPSDPTYSPEPSVESVLREELAREDSALGAVAPILRHLIGHDDRAVFADEIVARVRGMAEDVARQLIGAMEDDGDGDGAGGGGDGSPLSEAAGLDALTTAIAGNAAFLAHVHALALEWRLAMRLQERLGLDPVLSPLVQALIGSPEPETAALSMNLLAAQARFGNAQRRMQLPLSELPGDLLHTALIALRTLVGTDPAADRQAAQAEQAIRAHFDEAASRLGLIARVVTGMGGGAVAALSLAHAGAAIFLTALALASGQDRDLAALSASESRHARLALALCAAGLKPQAVEEQLLLLHPEASLPPGLDRIEPDRASAILAGAEA